MYHEGMWRLGVEVAEKIEAFAKWLQSRDWEPHERYRSQRAVINQAD